MYELGSRVNLGRNVKLLFGDSIQKMQSLRPKSAHLVLADLPYGNTNHPDDKALPILELWDAYERVLKPDGAVVLFAMQPFTTDLINGRRDWFRYNYVWDKRITTGFLNANKQPLRRHEDILVFSPKRSGGFTYNPQMREGKLHTIHNAKKTPTSIYNFKHNPNLRVIKTNLYYPHSILEFQKRNFEKLIHPNQKPLPLLKYLILTYSLAGQTVLDNTMGSGSTVVAAIHTNRKAIGIEKSSNTFHAALERIKVEMMSLKKLNAEMVKVF